MGRSKTELDELKIAALQLSKMIKAAIHLSIDASTSLCLRLQILPEFKSLTTLEIHTRLSEVTLSQCMLLIALEMGASSWNDLIERCAVEPNQLDDESLTYIDEINDGILNIWFATYQEAKDYQLSRQKAFLFSYKNTFFVCMPNYIDGLGVSHHDPDWDKIERDWVKPKCDAAKKRLKEKLIQARIERSRK